MEETFHELYLVVVKCLKTNYKCIKVWSEYRCGKNISCTVYENEFVLLLLLLNLFRAAAG